jgi:parallel beta-helix repeat protein
MAIAACLALCATAHADELLVPAEYPTIQAAIDAAVDGDVVIVAPGTYTGPGNRDIDFKGKAITVRSKSGPENCIIDCQATWQEPHRGFYFHSGEQENSVVDGFTIKNGYTAFGGGILCEQTSPTITNCTFSGNSFGGICCEYSSTTITNCSLAENIGSAIYSLHSTLTVTNCIITNNTDCDDGAIFCSDCNLTITNCTITGNPSVGIGCHQCTGTISQSTVTDNHGDDHGGISCVDCNLSITDCTISGNSGEGGGGINCWNSTLTLADSTISNNTARGGGGICGIYCWESSPGITRCTIVGNSAGLGGGIHCETSSPTITDCTISDNSARDGGAIYSFYSSSLTTTNCTISSNSASNGGGIYMRGGNSIISNCIISGNISYKTGIGPHGEGGGIFCWESASTIINCTITGNTASKGGGLNGCYGPISNCIIWDNSADNGPQLYHSPDVTYSCIQNHTAGGQGNIGADPCFVEPGNWVDANDPNIIVEPSDPNAVWVDGDYHLLPDSPCIDAGDPNYIAEPNETDLDGNPRVRGGRIDMGAYETIMHETRLMLLPRVINRKSKKPRIMVWVRLPQGIAKDQIDSDEPLILYPGGIKAIRQFVFDNRRRGSQRVSIFAFFDKTELMDAITANGRVELQVLGHLRQPGQYFYGTDTIRIKTRRLRSSLKVFPRARVAR